MKQRNIQKYELILQKIEKAEGYDIDADLKQKMKISRVQPNDPTALMLKRNIAASEDKLKVLGQKITTIDLINKDKLLEREDLINQLTTKCKKFAVDILNNSEFPQEETEGKNAREIRRLEHESGLLLDVLNDEHESIIENLKKSRDTNTLQRVKLDKQRIRLNQIRRENAADIEKLESKEAEIEHLKRELGKEEDSSEEDEYDDPTILSKKRGRKFKKQIE